MQECWSRCSRDAKCEMWVWCGHKAGCDDAGEFNGVYPHHGCQLMQLPKVLNATRDPAVGAHVHAGGLDALTCTLCLRRRWTRRCGIAGLCSLHSSLATSTVRPYALHAAAMLVARGRRT